MRPGATILASADKPAPGVIGRFSPLRWIGKHDTVTIGNAGYTVDIQRVFKVNALVPQVQSGTYGQVAFAGAVNMRTPDGHWITDLPASEYSITSKQTGPWLADVGQSVDHGGWKGTLTAHFAAGYPSLWFHFVRTAGTGPIAGAVMGYDWAGRFAPLAWSVGDTSTMQPLARTNGHTLDLPIGGAKTIYATYHDDRGITGCLRFSPAPSSLKITDAGVFWEYAGDVDNADVEYLTATSGTAKDAVAVAAKFPQAPTSLTETFASTDGHSSVTLDAGGSGLIVPAALTDVAQVHVSTVEGDFGVDVASTRTFTLPSPPNIENLTPSFRALPAKDQARVSAWVRGILKAQLPGGSFGFSQQRGFYDSMTCCSLAEVYPQLPANLKPAVRAALVKGLDHLWRDQKDCKNWPGISVAPEQDFFIQTGVDYAEIMGFTLQATALYGALVDHKYVDKRWPSIDRQFAQLRIYDDWSGLSYANPGPDFYQIIPEGSIGGYLAWHALYHLSKAHGHAKLAAEARARAAMSYQAILSLYRWKPEYGEAVINGINQGHLEVMGASSPWAYLQYSWFTFLPGFALPHDDTFHIWHMLAKLPWWNWTDTLHSRQRANDGANVSALWRGGYIADVQAHPAVIPGRPVWWEAFDFTPVLLIPAEYWIHTGASTATSSDTHRIQTSSTH